MRRLLAIVFILLNAMQSSFAAAVSVVSMRNPTCDQASAVTVSDHAGYSVAVNQSPAGCIGSGEHGHSHGHCCPHPGGFAMAVALAALSMDSSASPVPQFEPPSFRSIVPDVPRPPPTRSA